MNTLSLFLYASDVFSSLSIVLGMFVIFGSFCLSFFIVYCLVEEASYNFKNFYFWLAVVIYSLSLFLVVLIPSKNTMYAIAASELGEEAVKSEMGQKVQKALSNWIDSQLDSSKK